MLDIEAIREDFPILKTQVHGHPLVYLDNAATTQVPVQVLDRVREHYLTSNANVHRGMHCLAHRSTEALEDARATVAAFIGAADDDCVVFTRGTTDSLNMLAAGLGHLVGPGDVVVTTLLEHHSNFVPWQQLCIARGAALRVVGLDERGDIDWDDYRAALSDDAGRVRIVACTGCSNVLGTAPDVARMSELAHDAGALFVLDAAQLMRHSVTRMADLGCDFIAFSGHKMLAGTGIGVLAGTRKAMELVCPRDFGGEMVDRVTAEETTWEKLPLRLEAGTPNYVGAIALAQACRYLEGIGREEVARREDALASHAVAELSRIPDLRILGNPDRRCGVVSFHMEGVHPLDLCTMLDLRGIALRSGHNCAQPLLASVGLTSASRLSPAFYNTFEEIDFAVEQIGRASALLRARR